MPDASNSDDDELRVLRNSGRHDPALRVHWHGPSTVVLRQGRSIHSEAPFLFLLLGRERALLLDTGADATREAFPLRTTIDHLIASWLDREGITRRYPLVVAHSHPHDDHIAGDEQLRGRPDTTIVGHPARSVAAFFGLDGPASSASFELGGRELEVVATPGHHRAAITLLDPTTGWLLTGDTVYPGRLYIDDDVAFAASLDLLAGLARDRAVTAVLGCHVEMSSQPCVDYPVRATEQPDELPLPMRPQRLDSIRDAARKAIGVPGRQVHDDFVLVNSTRRPAEETVDAGSGSRSA